MPDKKPYILSVGNDGADRLAKLNKMLAPTTQQFFKDFGLKENQKVLEIGCGTGNVTKLIAKQVGPNGHVTAIDLSEEQIAIAKQQVDAEKLTNINFHALSVIDKLPFEKEFDVVYSRLTIMHTSNFQLALQNMYDVVKPGGIIACEEISNAHVIYYPRNPYYEKLRQLLLALASIKGMDPFIADKLFTVFKELGLIDVNPKIVQPIYQTEEERSLIPQLLNEIKANLIHYGLIIEKEVEELERGIKEFIYDENSFITFPATMQIWGRKPLAVN